MKRSTTQRNNKLPVFHPIATKLAAVKEVNTLTTNGLSRNKAIENVRKQLKVHRTTVVNWLSQYGGAQVTNISPQQANHRISKRGTECQRCTRGKAWISGHRGSGNQRKSRCCHSATILRIP